MEYLLLKRMIPKVLSFESIERKVSSKVGAVGVLFSEFL
jgi:hypothetical protein